MGTEALQPYNPAAADETEANYAVKRPVLPEGNVLLRLKKAQHFGPRGNQLQGKVFLQVLVLEGLESQIGKMTVGSVEVPLMKFDQPKEGQVEFDSTGNPMLSPGQIQHQEITNIEWANFTGTFGVPKFPEAQNEAAINAWLEALNGRDGLAKLVFVKAHSYETKTGETKEVEDSQEIRYFRPFKRLDPKKGEVDELGIFRQKLGVNLRTHTPEGEEL